MSDETVIEVEARVIGEDGAPAPLPVQWPGVFAGIPNEVYQALPGISRSGLEKLHQSPGHFHACYIDPYRPQRTERSGQLEGTLAHCAILEPEAFHNRYVVPPKDAPRRPSIAQWQAKKPSPESIDAMAWWATFEKEHKGARIITPHQYEVAWRQADNVHALGEVADVLGHGEAEVSALWIDPETGEMCRCRPDYVARYGNRRVVLLDVKTTDDASDAEFAWQVSRKRYHVQDAFYSDGFAAASGDEVMGFVFIAVESEYPYAANALMLGNASRAQGRTDYRRDLNLYAQCKRTNTWPAYGGDVKMIELPRLARFADRDGWRT